VVVALSVKSPLETAAAPKERTYKPTKAELAAIRKAKLRLPEANLSL
jgi:hypothetical protein